MKKKVIKKKMLGPVIAIMLLTLIIVILSDYYYMIIEDSVLIVFGLLILLEIFLINGGTITDGTETYTYDANAIYLIDDGSKDKTWQIIESLHKEFGL